MLETAKHRKQMQSWIVLFGWKTYIFLLKYSSLIFGAYLWWEEFKFLRMWHLNETDNKTDWTLSCSFHRDVCILVDIAISIAHPASCSSLMLNYSKNWNRRIHFCQFIVNQNFTKNCNKVIAQEYLHICLFYYLQDKNWKRTEQCINSNLYITL